MKRKRKAVKPGAAASRAVAAPQSAPAVDLRMVFLRGLAIFAAVLWIYWPAVHGLWLWDDALLISDNALVRDPGGWWKIWLEPDRMLDFQPVEVSMVWLEWHLWSDHTSGYHAVSILLHVLSALLVWRLLAKLGLRYAWLGGMLFAVHPVMVESVAWMAELKNTLSLPPFLLAMCAYVDYDARGRRGDYFRAIGFFVVAMLCKTSMAMFPFIILLYAWHRRGRIGAADIKAAAPFFAISVVVGLVAVWFLQRATASFGLDVGDHPPGGVLERIFFAGSIIAFYFIKAVVPMALSPIYPKWSADFSSVSTWLDWFTLFAVIGLCWLKRETWGRAVLLGFGFFVINLLPFVGLNSGPYMGLSWVMDHILYLPIVGLVGLAVAGMGELGNSGRPARECMLASVTLLLGVLAFASHGYAGLYRSSEALWVYTLKVNPDAWPAHNGLGFVLLEKGDAVGAADEFRKTIALAPNYAKGHSNLAMALARQDRLDDALAEFQTAVQLNSSSPYTDYNYGTALLKKGRAVEAIRMLRLAEELNPGYADIHFNLALALAKTGQIDDAIGEYRATVAIDPNYVQAHMKLGELLMQQGKAAEAAAEYDAALKNDPHYKLYQDKLRQPAGGGATTH